MTLPRATSPRLPEPPFRFDGENERQFRRQLERWMGDVNAMLTSLAGGPEQRTDANRGSPDAGRVIYNSDDGNLNIGTGAGWILPDGTAT